MCHGGLYFSLHAHQKMKAHAHLMAHLGHHFAHHQWNTAGDQLHAQMVWPPYRQLSQYPQQYRVEWQIQHHQIDQLPFFASVLCLSL